MAFHRITEFFYDTESKNIIIQFQLNLAEQPTHETEPGDIATETFEAELFLDAGTTKIGEYHPGSVDGTILPQRLGRQAGQDPTYVPENPWPPV